MRPMLKSLTAIGISVYKQSSRNFAKRLRLA
jgi:hypothetical protein